MAKSGMKGGVKSFIGVVVLIFLVAAIAPSALNSLYNSSAYTNTPSWVPTILGILGVVGFIYILLRE